MTATPGRGDAGRSERAAPLARQRAGGTGLGARPAGAGAPSGAYDSCVVVHTLGFSTRDLEGLLALVRPAGIALVADIRLVPRSRHTPQWNREALEASLPARGLAYRHLRALGGFRRPRPDSPHLGWRHASFRGYADYMDTPAFAAALAELLALAAATPLAIACTEAVPWRCHRSLVADALTVRGVEVYHLVTPGRPPAPHALPPFARVGPGLRLAYPAAGATG